MYTIITTYLDQHTPVGAYQTEDEESARHIAKTVAEYPQVRRTSVFMPNPADVNGVGQMVMIASFTG